MKFATFGLTHVSSPTCSQTSITIVWSIQIKGEEDTYVFPIEAQPISLHSQLSKVPAIAKNVTAMTKRGQYRNVIVELKDGLEKIYLDEIGNVQFQEFFMQQDDGDKTNTGPVTANFSTGSNCSRKAEIAGINNERYGSHKIYE